HGEEGSCSAGGSNQCSVAVSGCKINLFKLFFTSFFRPAGYREHQEQAERKYREDLIDEYFFVNRDDHPRADGRRDWEVFIHDSLPLFEKAKRDRQQLDALHSRLQLQEEAQEAKKLLEEQFLEDEKRNKAHDLDCAVAALERFKKQLGAEVEEVEVEPRELDDVEVEGEVGLPMPIESRKRKMTPTEEQKVEQQSRKRNKRPLLHLNTLEQDHLRSRPAKLPTLAKVVCRQLMAPRQETASSPDLESCRDEISQNLRLQTKILEDLYNFVFFTTAGRQHLEERASVEGGSSASACSSSPISRSPALPTRTEINAAFLGLQKLQVAVDKLIPTYSEQVRLAWLEMVKNDRHPMKQSCIICMAVEPTHASTSCGHFSMCEACVSRLKTTDDNRCPVCRVHTPPDSWLKIHLACDTEYVPEPKLSHPPSSIITQNNGACPPAPPTLTHGASAPGRINENGLIMSALVSEILRFANENSPSNRTIIPPHADVEHEAAPSAPPSP
ncbi:unnamed protein product, partial [Amoebophrya sp. A25]